MNPSEFVERLTAIRNQYERDVAADSERKAEARSHIKRLAEIGFGEARLEMMGLSVSDLCIGEAARREAWEACVKAMREFMGWETA